MITCVIELPISIKGQPGLKVGDQVTLNETDYGLLSGTTPRSVRALDGQLPEPEVTIGRWPSAYVLAVGGWAP